MLIGIPGLARKSICAAAMMRTLPPLARTDFLIASHGEDAIAYERDGSA